MQGTVWLLAAFFIVVSNAHLVKFLFGSDFYNNENSGTNKLETPKSSRKPHYEGLSKDVVSYNPTSDLFPATDRISTAVVSTEYTTIQSSFDSSVTNGMSTNSANATWTSESFFSTEYSNSSTINSSTSFMKTTPPSDIPTTTLPETPTEETLPTWHYNTTVPETTTIPTTPPPEPFIAAFNTTCIAAPSLNVIADSEMSSDLAFFPPPYSEVNATCSDTEQVLRINATINTSFSAKYTIYLLLHFSKIGKNSYTMSELEFLMANESLVYERYYTNEIPYMVAIPIGKSYRCNFTTIFPMDHKHSERLDLNFTFKDIWIEAFRSDLYQEMGPAIDCQLSGHMLLTVIEVFIGLAFVLAILLICKVCAKRFRQRYFEYCGGYGSLDETERSLTPTNAANDAENEGTIALGKNMLSNPEQMLEEPKLSVEEEEQLHNAERNLDESKLPAEKLLNSAERSLEELKRPAEEVEQLINIEQEVQKDIQQALEKEFEKEKEKIEEDVNTVTSLKQLDSKSNSSNENTAE